MEAVGVHGEQIGCLQQVSHLQPARGRATDIYSPCLGGLWPCRCESALSALCSMMESEADCGGIRFESSPFRASFHKEHVSIATSNRANGVHYLCPLLQYFLRVLWLLGVAFVPLVLHSPLCDLVDTVRNSPVE